MGEIFCKNPRLREKDSIFYFMSWGEEWNKQSYKNRDNTHTILSSHFKELLPSHQMVSEGNLQFFNDL